MTYKEISFFLQDRNVYSDIVIAKLNDIDFEGYMETENGVQAYIQSCLLDQKKLDQVIKDLRSLFSFDFDINEIENENWNKKWEKSFHPVKINKDCVVRAHFHASLPEYKYEIVITPKMSFGTGHHETTSLMIRKMLKLDIKNKDVLDVGCGTGILSILSKMLGSNSTLGIDIDEWSYKNAFENADLNNINGVNFQLSGIDEVNDKFDILLVNLNRNIIISNMSKYVHCMKIKADLLLSGFFSDEDKIIRKHADSLGLRYVSCKNKNKWSLLHFIK